MASPLRISIGRFAACLLALAALAPVRAMSQPAITDGAFSSPNYVGTSPGWAYLNGMNGGWNFYSNNGNNSGISDNVNNWFLGTPPVGDQAAFLQRAGVVSQTISGLVPGQAYEITLYAADRPNYNTDPFMIAGNGVTIGYVDPTQTAFNEYTSQPFTSPVSSMTLSFTGTDIPCTPYAYACDWDSAINGVSITPVPASSLETVAAIEVDEPGSLPILIGPLMLLAFLIYSRQNIGSPKFRPA